MGTKIRINHQRFVDWYGVYSFVVEINTCWLIGDDFMAKSILEGIVYDKTTPEGIVYAASICYPQTDLYVPISITISPDGKISMKKEELLEEVYDEDTSAR